MMILEQHYLACLAQASYFIADPETGSACVVDPRRDVSIYLEAAEKHGVRIEHVALTHFHADFVSGHIELQERTGATIHLGANGKTEYASSPLADGDEIVLGKVRLRALETPGHTPESICLLVFDGEKDEPHAVLTGDTCFIGDVGRPDLMASVGMTATELGGQLYDSLRQKLLPLPDATLLYPGHGAGSMCGKNLSTDTVSTIGKQRASNYALQPMERDAFIGLVASGQPQTPQYFPHDARLNRATRESLDSVLARVLQPLSLAAALELQAQGTAILDCRDQEQYERKHVHGSVWVGLDGKFATWAGTVLAPDQSIVILAEDGRENEAAMRLGRIGHDAIEGFVAEGTAAIDAEDEHTASSRRCSVDDLRETLNRAPDTVVLDIRGPGEWEGGHIENAVHVPLIELEQRLDDVPRGEHVRMICGSGYRSLIANSLLERHGIDPLVDVRGGMSAWNAS